MNVLEIKDVYYRYPSAPPGTPSVLENINAVIEPGDTVRIVGRNGSGKTTLLKIIGGRLVPTKGVRIEKEDLKVVYLDQNASEFVGEALTVREQLAVGFGNRLGAFESSKSKSLQDLILGKLSYYKLSLEDKLDSFTSELSGGQRQIMALLSVLLGDFDLLLLDEYSASMDNISTQISNDLIRRAVIESRIAVVFVAHQSTDLEFNKEIDLITLQKGE